MLKRIRKKGNQLLCRLFGHKGWKVAGEIHSISIGGLGQQQFEPPLRMRECVRCGAQDQVTVTLKGDTGRTVSVTFEVPGKDDSPPEKDDFDSNPREL